MTTQPTPTRLEATMTETQHSLTKAQRQYMELARFRQFDYGWAGYRSTQTVRILESRGLIAVNWHGANGWRVTGLTNRGVDTLEGLGPSA